MNRQLELISVSVLAFLIAGCSQEVQKFTAKDALFIAKKTPETEALYRWNAQCLEPIVERACDSDWVTCVETDAWVVRYRIKPSCHQQKEEHYGMSFLINAESGRIMSRFPELAYIEKQHFCMEDYDCIEIESSNPVENPCYNFVHSALFFSKNFAKGACQCLKNSCILITENSP